MQHCCRAPVHHHRFPSVHFTPLSGLNKTWCQTTFVNCEFWRLDVWCCCIIYFNVHQYQLVPIYLSVRASVASWAVFPHNWAVFFGCVAVNFLLLRFAVFGLLLSKFVRFFGLFLLNNFSIKEYSFCQFCWGSEICFDLKQCFAGFLVRFCSLGVRTNISSLGKTWSFVWLCDRMGNSGDLISFWLDKGLVCCAHIQSITADGNRYYQ